MQNSSLTLNYKKSFSYLLYLLLSIGSLYLTCEIFFHLRENDMAYSYSIICASLFLVLSLTTLSIFWWLFNSRLTPISKKIEQPLWVRLIITLLIIPSIWSSYIYAVVAYNIYIVTNPLITACSNGKSTSCMKLGNLYHGIQYSKFANISRNDNTAYQWYLKACNQKNGKACYRASIAIIFANSSALTDTEKDKRRLSLLKQGCKYGYAYSCDIASNFYRNSGVFGKAINAKKMFLYFTKQACKHGFLWDCLVSKKQSCEEDSYFSIRYGLMTTCIDNYDSKNNIERQVLNKQLCQKNFTELPALSDNELSSLPNYQDRNLIQLNNNVISSSCLYIGKTYYINKNYKKSLQYLYKISKNSGLIENKLDIATAKGLIGDILYFGRGKIKPNKIKALNFLQSSCLLAVKANTSKIAKQIYGSTCYQAGWMYLTGDGVLNDKKKAITLLSLATKLNDPKAEVLLASIYLGENINKDQAKTLIHRAYYNPLASIKIKAASRKLWLAYKMGNNTMVS